MVCVLGVGTCKVERVNARSLEDFQTEVSRIAVEHGLRGSAANAFNSLTRWSLTVEGPMRNVNRYLEALEMSGVVHTVTEKDVKELDAYTTPDNFYFIVWEYLAN